VSDRPLQDGDQQPDPSRIPDHLIDAFLDGDLDDRTSRSLRNALRKDLDACERVARTRRMIDELRSAPDAPDLSGSILSEVNRRRRFMTPGWRRFVSVGRLAVAAGIVLFVGMVAIAQRYGNPSLTPTPRPLTEVAQAVPDVAAEAVGAVQVAISEPATQMRVELVEGSGLCSPHKPTASSLVTRTSMSDGRSYARKTVVAPTPPTPMTGMRAATINVRFMPNETVGPLGDRVYFGGPVVAPKLESLKMPEPVFTGSVEPVFFRSAILQLNGCPECPTRDTPDVP